MFFIFLLGIWALNSCRTTRAPLPDVNNMAVKINDTIKDESMNFPLVGALPELIIYRTRADYRLMVPVMMDDDKNEIVSFPGPGDLYVQGELALPVTLENGYLLDIRGIGPNMVFLKITYEEYAALISVPSLTELQKMILDKDPFLEMYSCGYRKSAEEDIALAEKIVRGGFKEGCVKIR